jgi:hypothetical protein
LLYSFCSFHLWWPHPQHHPPLFITWFLTHALLFILFVIIYIFFSMQITILSIFIYNCSLIW